MTRPLALALFVSSAAAALASLPLAAHEIAASPGNADADFDVIRAKVTAEELHLVFAMEVSGKAGDTVPTTTDALAGTEVFAYVWPTALDSGSVGFEAGQGILALAVTAHPDFDDTPLFDEDGDGDLTNDGRLWHSHWVVLGPEEAACPGGLKVIDIPEGARPTLPATWPGLPLLIDSPGYSPTMAAGIVSVRVPPPAGTEIGTTAFDGVTSGLRVSADLHAPLLCVEAVFDVASGDLSLPGRVE